MCPTLTIVPLKKEEGLPFPKLTEEGMSKGETIQERMINYDCYIFSTIKESMSIEFP